MIHRSTEKVKGSLSLKVTTIREQRSKTKFSEREDVFMNEIQNRNLLSINETVARSKLEGLPITETALRRWVRNGTLHATYAGRKALIYWPNLVKLLCGESA